jgi:hypothetical protein
MLAVHLLHARLAPRPVANARAVIAGWRDFRAGRLGPRGSESDAIARPARLGDAASSGA